MFSLDFSTFFSDFKASKEAGEKENMDRKNSKKTTNFAFGDSESSIFCDSDVDFSKKPTKNTSETTNLDEINEKLSKINDFLFNLEFLMTDFSVQIDLLDTRINKLQHALFGLTNMTSEQNDRKLSEDFVPLHKKRPENDPRYCNCGQKHCKNHENESEIDPKTIKSVTSKLFRG